MKIAKTRRVLRKITGSAGRAVRAAALLDEVVDARAGSLPRLPESARRDAADELAELALLAQDYRRFAAGWVSDRELKRKGEAATARLVVLRSRPMEQLIERE